MTYCRCLFEWNVPLHEEGQMVVIPCLRQSDVLLHFWASSGILCRFVPDLFSLLNLSVWSDWQIYCREDSVTLTLLKYVKETTCCSHLFPNAAVFRTPSLGGAPGCSEQAHRGYWWWWWWRKRSEGQDGEERRALLGIWTLSVVI